jgi:hypothetical protein
MPIKPATPPVAVLPPIDTVNVVDPASPTVATQIPATISVGPPGELTTSVTNGQITVVPQPGGGTMPVVEGLELVNHGEDAHFAVVHGYCGKHRQGSLIKLSDLPDAANIVQLVKLGALRVLSAFEAVAKPAVLAELVSLGLTPSSAAALESAGERLIPFSVLQASNPTAGATPTTSGGQS